MSKINHIIILIASLSLIFSSCDSNEKSKPSLDGEWIIYSRQIECFGEGDTEVIAKVLQENINKGFQAKMNVNSYTYMFGNLVSTQDATYEYSETARKKESESGMPLFALTGYYKNIVGGLTATVEMGSYDNWEFTSNIVDLNNEHVMFKQNLTSKDIEIISDVYLGSGGGVDSKITGVLKTKAEKKKK